MLKIENFVTPSPEQWMFVIDGMRNPKDSWDRMDSAISKEHVFFMGEKDEDLAMRLAKGGPVHAKYRRQLPIHVKVTAPLYWWKEFDTYRVGVCPNPTDIEMNSCSTMHRIHSKPFSRDMFSCEHLDGRALNKLDDTIEELNCCRELFLVETDEKIKKHWWWQMIQLLPSSYNQTRSLSMNYEVGANMLEWREFHKQDCWRTLCAWLKELPYSTIMTGDLSRE